MYGALEVHKMIKDGTPQKEAINSFMKRVLGSIDSLKIGLNNISLSRFF